MPSSNKHADPLATSSKRVRKVSVKPVPGLLRQVAPKDEVCALFELMAGLAVLQLAAPLHGLAGAVHHHILPVASCRVESLASLDHRCQQFGDTAPSGQQLLFHNDGVLREPGGSLLHHGMPCRLV